MLYGSVCNSEGRVLHRISARIFCFFMPRGGFLDHGSDFSALGSDFSALGLTFWPRDNFGQFWGPEKDDFAVESFCEGLAGKSILPK